MADLSVHQLKWHCHVAVTMSTQLMLPANFGILWFWKKKNSIWGIYIILYYLHKIRLYSYFNCTTLDLHLSQLHLYDYRLHGSRAIHFRGKGVKGSLRKPEEGEINSSPVQLPEMGKLLFYAEETNYMILGVTQLSSEKLVPTNLQDDIQETAVYVTPERNIPYFYVNQ